MVPIALFLLLGVNLLLNRVEGAGGDSSKPQLHDAGQDPLGSWIDPQRYKMACPDYRHYAVILQ